MANGDTIWSPANWEQALGSRIQDFYTPEEQFAQFRTGIRPQWQYAQPLRNIQNRLQQRYMLGFPGSPASTTGAYTGAYGDMAYDAYPTAPATTAPAAFNNTFRDYLGTVRPGNYLQDPATLRTRARQAADIANMTTAQLAQDYAPGSPGFNQAAWYRMMYGGEGGDSISNQIALVNLLAAQRPGGGEYTGRMANAIRGMVSELYSARQAASPGASFLDWYLNRTR